MNIIEEKIKVILSDNNIVNEDQLSVPPNLEMGDFALPMFNLAKKEKTNPVELANTLANNIKISGIVKEIRATGPYLNFYLDPVKVADLVLEEASKKEYGQSKNGEGKKIMVEYGCPNPMKVFHLGHLKNLITGESVARIMRNSGYKVIKANYQGDVGMHQAKAMWGLMQNLDVMKFIREKSLDVKLDFLGKIYTQGARAFEKDGEEKEEILKMNEKIYSQDESIYEVYNEARQWSLDYFEQIYKKLGVKFDEYYFESEMFKRGKEIVIEYLSKGVFVESQGAIIFEGSRHGLHDRVFINSKGYPTYEAKELALAEMRYDKHHPDRIIHVVGKEQTEYFKVVFKAMEEVIPESAGKSYHLVGGYLQLKGMKKMSSRLGNVISGDELLNQTEEKIKEIMSDRELDDKDEVVRKVTGSVLKYAMLKSNVSQDVGFDMDSSVSLSGASGPYLMYIVARIKSILQKAGEAENVLNDEKKIPQEINESEKQLLLKIASYPQATKLAADELDPSKIAQYLFSLAQDFNSFYDQSPIVQTQDMMTKNFRLNLIKIVEKTMTRGLELLGIETVEKM